MNGRGFEMRKIAIFNQKGGVGKTLTTINLAGCYSKAGKKVLVVDCDAQANTTTAFTSVSGREPEYTLVECIKDGRNVKGAILPVYGSVRGRETRLNIDLFPISEEIDFLTVEKPTILKDLLKEVEDDYDYVLFDCAPQRTDIMTLALCAAEYVVVPAFPEIDSVSGYGMVMTMVNYLKQNMLNNTIEILGIVINNITMRNSLEKYMYEEICGNYGDTIFKSVIRRSTIIMQSKYFGTPICYFRPTNPATKDYVSLASEIDKRIEIREKRVGK